MANLIVAAIAPFLFYRIAIKPLSNQLLIHLVPASTEGFQRLSLGKHLGVGLHQPISVATGDLVDVSPSNRRTGIDGAVNDAVEPTIPAFALQIVAHLVRVSAQQLLTGIDDVLRVVTGQANHTT